MANKKYNDFDEGTYSSNKIFLQADPDTGALEKIFLPAIGLLSYIDTCFTLTGSDVPVAVKAVNNITGLTFTRSSTGVYNVIYDSAITATSAYITINYNCNDAPLSFCSVANLDDDGFDILCTDALGNPIDAEGDIYIYIRVYPGLA